MGKPSKPVNNVKTPPFSSGLWKKGGVLDHYTKPVQFAIKMSDLTWKIELLYITEETDNGPLMQLHFLRLTETLYIEHREEGQRLLRHGVRSEGHGLQGRATRLQCQGQILQSHGDSK